MEKTIKWHKVKCSAYDHAFGIRLWTDLVDFITKHVGYDYTIEGQTDNIFEGVQVYYEDGHFKPAGTYIENK